MLEVLSPGNSADVSLALDQAIKHFATLEELTTSGIPEPVPVGGWLDLEG